MTAAVAWNDPIDIDSVHKHAERLLETLVDEGPATAVELCKWLGWSRGRLSLAMRYARNNQCRQLGLVIPHPTPDDGWRYQVTTEWLPVQAGSSYSLGVVESRLRGVLRDVEVVLPHLEQGTVPWRRANFLAKHLSHITRTLDEINGSR